MKICFLAGANSLHSYRWVSYFVERGHDVHWISFYGLSIDTFRLNSQKNFSYYECSPPLDKPVSPSSPPMSNILRMFSLVRWVKRLLKDIRPDLLHAHSVGVYGIVAALAGVQPLVATAWGSDVLVGGKLWFKKPLVKFVLKKADLITCDANHMVEAMVALGGDRRKMKVIMFGIETDKFCPARKDEALIRELDVERCCTVMSLRNFLPVYDIYSLIRAIPTVVKAVPGTKFVIAGTGREEEGIKRLAQELSVTGCIRFIGWVTSADLPKYLTSMDVYVSTSLSDAGLAASTGEAMACGLPVVITDSGENGEWVTDGDGGFLVPVRRPDALAEGIVRVLKDDGFRVAAGVANRKTILEKLDYSTEMAKMETLCKALSAGPTRRPTQPGGFPDGSEGSNRW